MEDINSRKLKGSVVRKSKAWVGGGPAVTPCPVLALAEPQFPHLLLRAHLGMTVKRRPGRRHSEPCLSWGGGVLPGDALSPMVSPHPYLLFPRGRASALPRGLGLHQ